MKTTEQRITALHRKTQELRLRRERNILSGLAAVSVVLLVVLTRIARNSAGILFGTPENLTGASLLDPDVGGYVMAAVLSFMAGVAVTIAIIRGKKNSEFRIRNSEIGDQNSDIGDGKSEIRNQNSEFGNRRSETAAERPSDSGQ